MIWTQSSGPLCLWQCLWITLSSIDRYITIVLISKWIMLHTIFWGTRHFFMSGHFCLTIYKMGDLWKVTRFINKIRTWHSILRSSLQILKNAFECPNVVRYLKWWLFHQLWKCEWLHAFFFAYQPSVIVPGKIVNLLSGHEIYKSQRKMLKQSFKLDVNIFIGPESDHWKCLSVTHSLTAVS